MNRVTAKKNKKSHTDVQDFWWVIRVSNPGPLGYEPRALTN